MIGVDELRASAAAWLRYRRRCPIVSFERGLEWNERPDIYGVTIDRKIVEIEIKVSLSDFCADAKKRKWKGGDARPKQFYWLVPPNLVRQVESRLKDGHGLMTVSDDLRWDVNEILVVKRAKINSEAERVPLKEIIRMVWHQSGTLCGLAKEIAKGGRS